MRKLTLLLAVIAVVGLAAYAIAAPPKEIVYDVGLGTVTFNHEAHLSTGNCVSCHHTGEQVSCKNCHTKDSKLESKKAFHGQCIGCHKEKAAGPVKCAECHIR